MKKDFLKKHIEMIEIPENLHERSMMGIRQALNEGALASKKSQKKFGRMVRYSAAAMIIGLLSTVAVYQTNEIFASNVKGYFKDVMNWRGTVTDTEYAQASEEIELQIKPAYIKDNQITIPITIEIPNITKPPFGQIEALGILNFELNNGIRTLSNKDIDILINNRRTYDFDIPKNLKLLEEIDSKSPVGKSFYGELVINDVEFFKDSKVTLSIKSLQSLKKADAPLLITGVWNMDVTIQN